MPLIISIATVFLIAIFMSMTGRGGGNFYVPILIALGFGAHHAATTAQLILVASALAAMLVFSKNKAVDWKLALVIDPPTDLAAFIGGYYAHAFPETLLKVIFAFLLVLAAYFMVRPVKEKPEYSGRRFGFWRREYKGDTYVVNLWAVLPITAATGFVAGMVGISGGSFKVPLMVLACGVPMRIAVGTSSAMVAATALMGFLGHTAGGDFNPASTLLLAGTAALGGVLGGFFSLHTKPKNLKKIFAFTTLAAAIFMAINAWLG